MRKIALSGITIMVVAVLCYAEVLLIGADRSVTFRSVASLVAYGGVVIATAVKMSLRRDPETWAPVMAIVVCMLSSAQAIVMAFPVIFLVALALAYAVKEESGLDKRWTFAAFLVEAMFLFAALQAPRIGFSLLTALVGIGFLAVLGHYGPEPEPKRA